MGDILWAVLAVFAASFTYFFVLEWRASKRRFAGRCEEQPATFRDEQLSAVNLVAEESQAA